MYHVFFILSSINGHLGCFHVLVIVYSAAVNIGVHVSLQTRFFSRYMLRSGIAGSYGSSAKLIQCFRFKNKIKKKKRNLQTVLQCLYQFTFLPAVYARVPFSTHSFHLLLVDFFDDGHSEWYEVIAHCSFDLHLSNKLPVLSIFNIAFSMLFHEPLDHLYVFFGEMSV